MKVLSRIITKETTELLASGRGLAWLITTSLILSAFSLLLVGNTELSLLDNAQAVYMMMGIVTALGCLLMAALGSDAVAGERERGTLVTLLLTPLTPGRILSGKMAGLAIGWLVAYLISLPYLWAVGATGQNLFPAVAYLALFGTPVALGFGFYSLSLSARLGSVRSALAIALITLIFAASPLLIGPSLRQNTVGKAFDAVNPFAAALNSYDSAVIDSQGVGEQLPRLAVSLVWLGVTFWWARRSVHTLQP